MIPPYLLLALLATPSTSPVTIHTITHHQEATMAQPIQSPGGHPPVFVPRGPNRPAGTTFQRIGRDASNPTQMSGGARPAHGNQLAATGRNLTPTEHTARPTPR